MWVFFDFLTSKERKREKELNMLVRLAFEQWIKNFLVVSKIWEKGSIV
jgi:hypothetical protein